MKSKQIKSNLKTNYDKIDVKIKCKINVFSN
jgi:hypothetical protein